MKNKKGFTLIEIIICIALIAIIGVGSVIGINVVTSNKENTNLNNRILEAAKVFANIEKDSNGDIYSTAVQSYAKGVKIPLQTLVEKGYIEDDIVDQVYKNNNYTDYKNNDYYVLLTYGDEKNYCIEETYTLSWTMSEGTPIYLCDVKKEQEDNSIPAKEIVDNTSSVFPNYNIQLFRTVVSEKYCEQYDCTSQNIIDTENGLYYYNGLQSNKINENTNSDYYSPGENTSFYYYRGEVKDNYVKYGKDENGKDVIWRILWFNDEGTMKLALNDTIPITVTNIHGNKIELKKGDKINTISESVNNSRVSNLVFIADLDSYSLRDGQKTFLIKKENVLDKGTYSITNKIRIGEVETDEFNFYKNLGNEWFEKFQEKDESILKTEENFCYNNMKRGYNNYNNYLESASFICWSGDVDKYEDVKIATYYLGNYSSKVGLLNIGEVKRAGIGTAEVNNISLANNFLMSDKSYVLGDLSEEDPRYDTISRYIINKTKIEESESISRQSYGRGYHFLYEDDNEPFLFYSEWSGELKSTVSSWSRQTFHIAADGLKPTITVDYNKITFSSGDGTEENPYVMSKK